MFYFIVVVIVIFLYITYLNGKKVPNIKETVIYSSKVSEEFKIVQLTDLHIGMILGFNWFKKVVDKVNLENADLIVVTGDFSDGNPKKHKKTFSLFTTLKSKNGIYAVTGNHDYYSNYDGWMKLYKENDINFLFNSHVKFGNIVISGVPDLMAMKYHKIPSDIKEALRGTSPENYIVHLDHRPASFKLNSQEQLIDLQLSGHTHGGMLPLLDKLVAKCNNGYVAGSYKSNGSILNLSNGAGIWAGFPLRLFHEPEINVIILKPNINKAIK